MGSDTFFKPAEETFEERDSSDFLRRIDCHFHRKGLTSTFPIENRLTRQGADYLGGCTVNKVRP